jgi:hypothetical protein
MADQERPEQELTPGYYDNQFGNRLGDLRKVGAEPPSATGGTTTSGGSGCLKGGGGIGFGLLLLVRLLFSFSGCRDSSSTPTYTAPTYTPSYTPPPQIKPIEPVDRDPVWNNNRFQNNDDDVLPNRNRFQPGKLPGDDGARRRFPEQNGGLKTNPWDVKPVESAPSGLNPSRFDTPKPKAEVDDSRFK